MNSIKNLSIVLLALKLTDIADPSWLVIIGIFVSGAIYQYVRSLTGANGVVEQTKRELALAYLRRVAKRETEKVLKEQKHKKN